MDDKPDTETVDAELVPRDRSAAPLALVERLVETDPERALALVDKRTAFFKKVREKSLSLTYPKDWVDMQGKPYLQSIGCERLKPLWGIYTRGVKIEPSMDETRRRLRSGEHVSVEVTGLMGSRVTGEESEFVGARSSDDEWFAGRKDGIAGLDPEDLRKAAYSNFEVNGIMRLLGLRGLTWPVLGEHGIKQEDAAGRATFGQSGETSGQSTKAVLVREIREGLELVNGKDNALEALYILSKFKGKDGSEVGLKTWPAAEAASEKWLTGIAEKVRKEVSAWKSRQEQSAPASS